MKLEYGENSVRKAIVCFLGLVLGVCVVQPVFSGPLRIGVSAGYYVPSDSAYKDLYGQGNLMFGGSFSFELIRKFEVRVDGGYFQDSGKMNLTKEDLRLSLLSGGLGVRLRFVDAKLLRPYVGGGLAIYAYKEDLPSRLEDVSKTAVGLQGEAGTYVSLTQRISLDVNFRYVFMNVKPVDEAVKLGGIRVGLGIVYQF